MAVFDDIPEMIKGFKMRLGTTNVLRKCSYGHSQISFCLSGTEINQFDTCCIICMVGQIMMMQLFSSISSKYIYNLK